jgi:hypothetical protein
VSAVKVFSAFSVIITRTKSGSAGALYTINPPLTPTFVTGQRLVKKSNLAASGRAGTIRDCFLFLSVVGEHDTCGRISWQSQLKHLMTSKKCAWLAD